MGVEDVGRVLTGPISFDFTGLYKADIDPVDGALVLDGSTYLEEARWR